jgi:hypothetical protein
MHTGAAQGVDADLQSGFADHLEIDHEPQVGHVGAEEIVAMRRGSAQSLLVTHAADVAQAADHQLIGPLLDPARNVLVGGAAVGRVVLEASISRRVVRGRHYDAISPCRGPLGVINQDGMRHRRCRRVLVLRSQHDIDAIGGEHFQRARCGRRRQGVRVDTQEQRARDTLCFAVLADGLRDGEHMPFIEGVLEGRAPMSGGAKRYSLRRNRNIRSQGEVGRDQPRHVGEEAIGCGLACQRVQFDGAHDAPES